MDPRTHDLRIQHVQRNQVQHGHGHDHQHVYRYRVQGQRGEQRRNHRQRQADVGHQAQEPAQRTDQQRIGHVQRPEQRRADHRQQQAQHEIAHHEGAHHVGDSLQAARRHQAILPVEELQKAAVDVVPPAQHEVHQERDERRHQHHLVKRAQARIDVIADGCALFVNPHLGDRPRLRRGLLHGGALLALFGRGHRQFHLLPALFFLPLPRRDYHLISLLLPWPRSSAGPCPPVRRCAVRTSAARRKDPRAANTPPAR